MKKVLGGNDQFINAMNGAIEVLLEEWGKTHSELYGMKYRLFNKAWESVESQLSNKRIKGEVMEVLDQDTSKMKDPLERNKFAAAVTAVIIVCRDLYKNAKEYLE